MNKCTIMARKNFVPSLFLSNVMSLAPKIDVVSRVVQNANYDLVCITESWLRLHIPDSVIVINGYNIIRRDRKEATHGGVCIYIKVTIPFSGFRGLVGKAATNSTPKRLF